MLKSEVTQLIKELRDTDQEIRENAFNQLVGMGESALETLLEVLEKDDRNESIYEYENRLLRKVLVEIGEPAFQGLLALLSDEVMGRAAVKTLMLFNDNRVIEPFIDVAKDPNLSRLVRHYAIDALGYLKSERAFSALIDLLKDENKELRGWAAYMLGKCRDERALELLRESLPHQVKGRFFDWREVTEKAIRKIQDPSFTETDPGFFDQYLSFYGAGI